MHIIMIQLPKLVMHNINTICTLPIIVGYSNSMLASSGVAIIIDAG